MPPTKLTLSAIISGFIITGLAAFSPVSANCDGCLAGDERAIWKTKNIPVCWESMETDPHDRQVVQDAITGSWQAHSGLTFTGWGQCESNSRGIRIAVDDSYWPRVMNFGSYLDGLENGMHLNFNLGGLRGFESCAGQLDYCNKATAIHEFGHALGFHHEQNRSDRPTQFSCINEQYQGGIPNEQHWGAFDMKSIMNYCSPEWNGGGNLSEGDIAGVSYVYPKVPVSAILDLQTSIQPGAGGRNRLLRYRDSPPSEGAMWLPAIYLTANFSDGSSIGPHDYNKNFAENVIFDDVSGDPDDLIEVSYWRNDDYPNRPHFAAQLGSTGKGTGTAELRVSFKNAPSVVATVKVEVVE